MKKLVSLLLALGMSCAVSFAQDVIRKGDGSELKVTILKADDSGVSYRNIDDPFGTVHFMSVSEDYEIQYGRALKPNMRYHDLKKLYSTKDYVHYESAAYQPGIMGIASCILPGLGDCLADEWGRGLIQFGGTAVLATASTILGNGYHYNVAAVVCAAGGLAVWVWSIVDAVQVSKIKNMYVHDYMKMYGMDLKLYPSVSCTYKSGGAVPTAGLTLALNF